MFPDEDLTVVVLANVDAELERSYFRTRRRQPRRPCLCGRREFRDQGLGGQQGRAAVRRRSEAGHGADPDLPVCLDAEGERPVPHRRGRPVGVADSSSGMALQPCRCREPAVKPDSTALLTNRNRGTADQAAAPRTSRWAQNSACSSTKLCRRLSTAFCGMPPKCR
jgi:hypothetical protein